MKTILAACLALTLLVTGNLWANPIATESLRLRQVPTSTHVQITWSVMEGEPKATEVKRDGAVIEGQWHALASFTANTGSGLKTQPATQFCDCDVPAGTHEYVIKAQGFGTGNETSQTTVLTVEANLTQPHDAGVPSADAMPWEIPEPTEIQGLDCLVECKAAVTPDGADLVKDAGVVTQKDTGTVAQKDANTAAKESTDDGGCSITHPAQLEGSFLLLLALGFLTLRRRRG